MAELENLLNSKTMTLKQYLSMSDDDIYIIPFTQRKYEWGKDEVKRLFNDFTALLEQSEDVHPLNVFTMSKCDDGLKIYDGQQRTLTCMLILAVISQQITAMGDYKVGEYIQSQYFVTSDPTHKEKDSVNKIIFDNIEDSQFFYKITNLNYQNKNANTELKQLPKNSNSKSLLSSYILISKLINKYFGIESKDRELVRNELLDFYNAIVDKCILIRLVAENEDIASNMFESLNNTGKDLEKYYVLKNKIVSVMGEDNVRDRWEMMDSNLINLSHKQFLDSVAVVLNGKTSTGKVLDALYDKYDSNSPEDMDKLLSFLVNASKEFLKICQTNQFATDGVEKNVIKYRKLSKYINVFNFTQHYPIILSMLIKDKDVYEINLVLEAILTLVIRNFYFNDVRANTIRNIFADLANSINDNKITTNELITKIKELYNTDAKTKPNIISKKCNNNNKIKTILTIVYNKDLRNSETEIKVDDVDLEHILPKNPNSNWTKMFLDNQEIDRYIYLIGNLTLWNSSQNKSLKNKDFKYKRDAYRDESTIAENNTIAKHEHWTTKEIDERSERLADKILSIFK